MKFALKSFLEEKQELINQYLDKILEGFDRNRVLIQAVKHSLMAGGKRLRPVLAISAAAACKKDFYPALPVCCAIEMVHTYSLIHDDLPAMDNDDLRRGVPTCHKEFGESTAILAGDALLTHAFHVLADPGSLFAIYPDAAARLELVAGLAAAAGINGMVEGQMLDMEAQNPAASDSGLDHIKKIHALKTGKMITFSVRAGALSVGAEPEKIDRLAAYADRIGLAFQIADDILNVEGDPEIMGKAAGSDDANDKMAFPSILGLEESKKYAKLLVDESIDSLEGFDDSADPLRAIAAYIINRDR